MTELHLSDGHPIVTEARSKRRRATEAAARPSIARTTHSARLPTPATQPKWELIAIWGFVVVSFAAFFLCFWTISAQMSRELAVLRSSPTLTSTAKPN